MSYGWWEGFGDMPGSFLSLFVNTLFALALRRRDELWQKQIIHSNGTHTAPTRARPDRNSRLCEPVLVTAEGKRSEVQAKANFIA